MKTRLQFNVQQEKGFESSLLTLISVLMTACGFPNDLSAISILLLFQSVQYMNEVICRYTKKFSIDIGNIDRTLGPLSIA